MLIQKSYWKKDNVDQSFILWNLYNPWYCHDPEGGKENQEQVRDEYEEYRKTGKLKENTYLFMVLERIVDETKKFSYNCADCGFPKFNNEGCPLCGD